MKKQAKRFTSLLCVLALCLSLLPASALAVEPEVPSTPEPVPTESVTPEPSVAPSPEPEPEESAEPEESTEPEPEEEVATFAEGDVAKIGDQGYATLGDAIDAANASNEPVTIEVLQSCNLDKAIAIQANKTVTVTAQEGANIVITDNNRKGVTLSTNTTLTVENLTINTNGQIYLNGKGGTLTFTNVDLSMNGGLHPFHNDGYYCCAISIEQPESSLTFDGCNVYIESYPSTGSAIRWNGSGTDSGYNVSILNGTTLTSTNCYSGFVGTCDIIIEDSTVNVLYHRGNGSNGSYYDIRNSTVNYTGNGSHGISAGGITVSDHSTVTSDNNGMYGIYAENIFEVDGTSKVTVTHNSEKGDYAGLKIRPNVKAGLVEAGAEITITDNYCSGLSNNGVLTFEEGAKLTITGNNNDKGTSSHGGGIYNSGAAANLTLPSDAVIYNNHSKTDGDDIFNNTTATITFGEVGSGWVLDGDPDCTDAIDGWYDDSEGNRWEAHDAPYHAVEFTEFETLTGMTTVTGLKALKAAHGLTPLEPGEETGDWERSKSKTATNLDSNFESDVTLSLPAAEETLESDIVFVVDKSSSSRAESTAQGVAMLEDLNSALSTTNATLKVGIIVFDGSAHVMRELSAYDSEDVAEKMAAEIPAEESTGGTNMEAGLLAAKVMLEADTTVPDNRKHVIVVSDGLTRLFTAEDGKSTQIIFNEQYADSTTYFGEYTTWCLSNGLDDGEYKVPGKQTWLEYYNSTIKPQVKADGDTYVMDYDGDNTKDTAPEKYIPYEEIADHAQAVDRAFYDAYNAYLDLSGAYRCYAVYTGNSELGESFMSALNRDAEVDFDSIYDDIYYLLDAGSSVVDVIGSGTDNDGNDYNFDFVNDIDNLKLTVGGKELDKDLLIDAQASDHYVTSAYVFGGHEDGYTYDFVLKYYANGQDGKSDECFVWEINVPVSNFAPVQLTYTVKLKNPQEAEGTYGEYDADGLDENGDPLPDEGRGLFTNNSATLYPVDSNGQQGRPENFAKPTVSYTVGTVTITPADITIYMGGDEGYEAVVGGGGAIAETTNSLPRPMFLVDAPEGVNPVDLTFTSSEKLTDSEGNEVKDEDGQPIYKAWTLVYAGQTASEGGEALYYMNPVNQGQDEVRVQFTQKNVEDAEPIISDSFNPTDVNEMFVDYVISLYTGTVQTGGITVTGENGVRYALGEVGTGTLRVRAVDDTEGDNNPVVTVTETIGEPVEAGEGAVTAPPGTTYTLNDTTVPVEADGVGLLFDGIIDDGANRTQALKDKVDATMGAPGRNTTRHYQAQYLDLVDAHNGNAWVKASGKVTVYWGYPSGTNQNTDFTLYHFQGLHRDGDNSGFEITDVDTAKLEKVKITKDANGISFQVTPGGFSPFVLVYETVEDDDDDDYNPPHRPSNPDKDDDEDDEPEDLNTEDHVAYIIGYTDGTVRPQGNIARSEVATIFFRLLTDEARETYWSQTNPYSDVAPDAWYNNAISTLTNMGILDGYLDGTFRPTAPITRSEFTKIAVSFFDYADEHFVYDGRFSDVEGNEWYVNFLAAAIEYGLIEGMPDGTFHPLDNITRAEACTIVNRTLGRAPHEDHLLPWREMITWPDNSNTDAWYYAAMQEATNSHDYAWTVEDREDVEEWTEKLEERDWAALERTWSDAHDAPGGEVMD